MDWRMNLPKGEKAKHPWHAKQQSNDTMRLLQGFTFCLPWAKHRRSLYQPENTAASGYESCIGTGMIEAHRGGSENENEAADTISPSALP